jgi:hypothetical protein
MRRHDEIYVAGYQGYDQLDPADSLAGEIGEDPLDAGYSPPDREPAAIKHPLSEDDEWRGESLDERLAEEEPEFSEADLDLADQEDRAGRLVDPSEGGLGSYESMEIATDVGRAGWGASAEEAAMHIIED